MAPKQQKPKKQPSEQEKLVATLDQLVLPLNLGSQQSNFVRIFFPELNSVKFSSKDETITRATLLSKFTPEQIKILITPLTEYNTQTTEIAVIINKLLNLSIWSLEELEDEDRQIILSHFTIPEENQIEVIESKITELNSFTNILTQIGKAIIATTPKAQTGMVRLINLALSDLYNKLYLLGIRAELLLASHASDFLSAKELAELHSKVQLPEGEVSVKNRSTALYNFIKKVNEGNLDETLDTPPSRQYAFDMALKLGLSQVLDELLINDLYIQELFLDQMTTIPAIAYSFMRGDLDICGKFLAPQIWCRFAEEQKISLVKAMVFRSGIETRVELLKKIEKTIDVDFYVKVTANENDAKKTTLKETLLPTLKKNIIADLKNQIFDYEIQAYTLTDIIQRLPLEVVQEMVIELNNNNLLSLTTTKGLIKSLEQRQSHSDVPIYTEKLSLLRELLPVLTDKMNSILANPKEASFKEIMEALEDYKLIQQEIKDKKAKKSHIAPDEKYIAENLTILYEKASQYKTDNDIAHGILTKASEIIQKYETEQIAAELIAKEIADTDKQAKLATSKRIKKEKQALKKAEIIAKEKKLIAEEETRKAEEKKLREQAEAAAEEAENIQKKQAYDLVANDEDWLKSGQKPNNKVTSTTNYDHKPNGGDDKLSSKAAHKTKASQYKQHNIGSEDGKYSKKILQTSTTNCDHKPNGDDDKSIVVLPSVAIIPAKDAQQSTDLSIHDNKKITENIESDLKINSRNSEKSIHTEDKATNQKEFTVKLAEKTEIDQIPHITFGNFGEDNNDLQIQKTQVEQLLSENQELKNRLKLLEAKSEEKESCSEGNSVEVHVEERLANLEQAIFYTPPPSLTDGQTVFFTRLAYDLYGRSYPVVSFPDTQGYTHSTPLLYDAYGYNFQDRLGVFHRLQPYNPNPLNQTTSFGPASPPGGGGSGRLRTNSHNKKKIESKTNNKLSDENFDSKLVVLSEEKFKDFDFTSSTKLKKPEPINYEQAEYNAAKQEAENRQNEKVSWLIPIKEVFEQLPDFKLYIPAHLMFSVLLAANKLPGGFGAHNFPELEF